MYKRLFCLICVFVVLTLTSTQDATADYTLTNGTTETLWIVYAEWQPRKPWEPAGWRTWGWYEIKPNATKSLDAPEDSEWVYIYVEGDESGEIRPADHTIRESASFLIHPWEPFSVLQTAGGDFIKSNRAQRSLERAEFYKYRDGGSHTITNVLGQETTLASRVFAKHSTTLQRRDIQTFLPQVLEGLKAPDTQAVLSPQTINLVVSNPNLLRQFIPDIDPKFVALLKTDQELKNLLRDPQVQRLLQNPAAIDELAELLSIGETALEVTPKPDLPAQQNLPDLPAQEIYDQAIDSVVWIHAGEFTGSGVLIDRKRKLIVTNQHVIESTIWVDVFFPYKQNGSVNKRINFYERNKALLQRERYLTKGKVIKQNVINDLAIVQLVQMPTTAREIKHDFSKNVEDSMSQGDIVHILGNPGERLWNYTQGTFKQAWTDCLPGDCLEIEGDAEAGNSGGPVLNGRGMLIGILTAGTDETVTIAAPMRNIKTLLNTVPVNLSPISAPTYPKQVFKIINRTGVNVPYEIQWSQSDSWESKSLETGFISTHTSDGQNISSGYPKIRFDISLATERLLIGSITWTLWNLARTTTTPLLIVLSITNAEMN
ncbi:MAG: serine protease [Candidatus Poribacteria bacterium]|nr:serine protease [Candidatus Poribacteria bacterium]